MTAVGMRALFVTASAEPWGAERSLRILLESRPSGWSCSLICSSDGVAELCRPVVGEVRLVPARKGKLTTVGAFSKALLEIGRDYDVIVLFSLKLLPLVLVARAARLKARVVVDLHGAPSGLDFAVARRLLRFVDGAIAISRFVVAHYARPNIAVVPRPIADTAERDGDAVRPVESGVVLGIAGRIDPEKRIEVAIDALRTLPSRFQLNIYGDTFFGGEEYLRQLKVSVTEVERIRFRGYVEPDEIYDEVDAIIVCNENEASGRTVGEAMLRRKLVFVPDRGGAQEFLDDSVTGFVYRALDSASLATAVESAFHPDRDLSALRSLAREKIIAERSPREVAREYFGLLSRIVEKGRGKV